MLRSYNVHPDDIDDQNWKELYEKRRRDALFAFTVPESQGSVILGRDHMGAIPLFYRVRNGVVESSVVLSDLVHGDETVSEEGVTTFVALGTVKLVSLFNEIKLVEPGTVVRVHPKGDLEVLYRYRFSSGRPSWSLSQNVETLERLLRQAARRSLSDSDHVGLYLSGGIDSGLTGHFLEEQGARVHAYTTTPWGIESAEGKLAQKNAAAIGASHSLVAFDTKEYRTYAESIIATFGNPVGAASALAIARIGSGTNVLKESHVFFAQNADTATASVADQVLLYFASFFPAPLRRRFHRLLTSASVLDNLVALRTTGLMTESSLLARFKKGYTTLEQLTLGGMLFAHSPVDGDIVIQPALKSGQIVSNLFYDIDVIEFLMAIPLWQRLSVSTETRQRVTMRKNVLRALARGVLPDDVIDRKKGLSVPVHTDHHARAFFDSLPTRVGGRTLTLPQHRFTAYILKCWTKSLPKAPAPLTTLFHD